MYLKKNADFFADELSRFFDIDIRRIKLNKTALRCILALFPRPDIPQNGKTKA